MSSGEHIYLLSFFSFRDNTVLHNFYDYCDRAMLLLSQRRGFVSAFGYISDYDLAKHRYVGITEFTSLDTLFGMLEDGSLAGRLTPPDDVRAMTLFADCNEHTYPGAEHQRTTPASVTYINPLGLSHGQRDSKAFAEYRQRQLMLLRGQQGYVGRRSFFSTNPTALYNVVEIVEWATEDAFYAVHNSPEYLLAERGGESFAGRGHPALYRLMLAYTRGGTKADYRFQISHRF